MDEELTPSLRRPVSNSVRSGRSATLARQQMSNTGKKIA